MPETTIWRRLLCRWRGHRWIKSGIETDKFYRSFWIVTCERCGVDQEDATP